METREQVEDVTHTFHCMEEVKDFIEKREVECGVRFVWRRDNDQFGKEATYSERKHKLMHRSHTCLYVYLGSRLYECSQGPDRQRAIKQTRKIQNFLKKTGEVRGEIVFELPANRTKKIGCQAQVIVKEIISFPQFEISATCKKWRMQELKDQLKDCMTLSTGLATNRLYLVVERGCHQYHKTGATNTSGVVTDKRLTQTVRKLVIERGIDNLDYIAGYLDCMSDEIEHADNSKRFKPSRAKIRCLINHCKRSAGEPSNELAERKKKKMESHQTQLPNTQDVHTNNYDDTTPAGFNTTIPTANPVTDDDTVDGHTTLSNISSVVTSNSGTIIELVTLAADGSLLMETALANSGLSGSELKVG